MRILKRILSIGAVGILAAGAACSHGTNIETDPKAIAAVRADLRLVGGETTWVAHGQGYELVTRTRGQVALLQPQLDGDAAAMRRVFPTDSLPLMVITVREVVAANKPYVTTAPLPNSVRGTIVDVVIPDPKTEQDAEKGRGDLPGFRSPTLPVVRAWLSAHASAVTHKLARENEADGEFEDPRVPAWAMETIPSLASDSLLDRYTKSLLERPDNLIPVATFFSMDAPQRRVAAAGGRGVINGGGDRGGETGRGGGMGGMGGGMGGGGRGGGRGGSRGGMGGGTGGGTGGRGSAAQGDQGLQGIALFEAQSYVFGRYLVARGGYETIAALVDGQMLGAPIANVLSIRKMPALGHMDIDWLQWLLDRGAQARR
ncbi:MAG: hypothetical protein ABI442_01330 [Gemmatimonadaceae bacterium]